MKRAILAAAILTTMITTTVGPPVDAAPSAPAAPAAPRVLASFPGDAFPAYDLGIQTRPYNVAGRDAGYSAVVGGRSLWVYGDTFAGTGGGFHSNTAALGVQGFLATREPVDGSGFPTTQTIQYSAVEANFNSAPGDLPRYWVWPTGIVPRAGTTSLVFFERGKQPWVTGSGAVGIADISSGQTAAVRRTNALFDGQDCGWGAPLLAGGYVYLYANKDAPGQDRADCPNGSGGGWNTLERMVARAPLADAGTRSEYRFWNGSTWVTSPLAAVDVMDLYTPTVSWNEGLGAYVAIGGIGTDEGSYSTAPAPQGPWTAPQTFVTPRTPVAGTLGNYAWIDHPEHAGGPDGEVMLVTYHRSYSQEGGDIQMLAVDTRPNATAELQAYITRTYQEMLGRAPTSAALADWVQRLGDRTDTVPSFVRYLARSAEGLRHRVGQAYVAILGRTATLPEKTYWAGEMISHGWGHDVLVSKLAAAAELSGDFPDDDDYVAAVFPLTLERAASATDISYWGGELANGMPRETLVRTLMRTAEAGELQARQAYTDILGRPATNTQADGVADLVRERIEIRIGVAATAEAIGV